MATDCNMLAIALFIEEYKRNMSNEEKDKQLEHDWLKHWCGALRNPSKTSCRIMRAYIDYLYILVGALNDHICWDC